MDLADDGVLIRSDDGCCHGFLGAKSRLFALNRFGSETPALQAFAVQVEELFVLFSVVGEDPFFRVMVIVDEGENHLLHVPGIWRGEVGRVEEIERDRPAVGRDAGLHARLVPHRTVMRHQ